MVATTDISILTLDSYLDVLRRLYVIEDLGGWSPSLRSSRAPRSGPKREFVDPSIAVAALGMSPDNLIRDLNTFGFIFECLCIRDLRVYSSALGGELSYYHDRNDLEADCVLHLEDGRYALIEFKLGPAELDSGAKHLNKLEELITDFNKQNGTVLGTLTLKIILTGGQYGYRRADGVYVIPIGCLGP